MKKYFFALFSFLISFISILNLSYPSLVFANNVANPINSTITVSKDYLPADGATVSNITITLKDNTTNIIPNDHVKITSTPDSGIVINGGSVGTDNITVATDSDGKAYFNVTSRNPSSIIDTLTIVDISDNPPVTIGTVTLRFYAAPLAPNPACQNPAPGSTPKLESAVAKSSSEITLTWSKANSPVTHYLLAFGTTSGQYTYGGLNIGNQDTNSYTVGSLDLGTKYYFVIKAVNGCNVGGPSNELSATTNPPTSTVTVSKQPNLQQTKLTLTSTPTPTPIINISTPTIFHPSPTPTPSLTIIKGILQKGALEISLVSITVLTLGGFIFQRYKRRR